MSYIVDDSYPKLREKLISLFDALGLCVVDFEPQVNVRSYKMDTSLKECMLTGECSFTIDVEALIGDDAWAMSQATVSIPPKDEMLAILAFTEEDILRLLREGM